MATYKAQNLQLQHIKKELFQASQYHWNELSSNARSQNPSLWLTRSLLIFCSRDSKKKVVVVAVVDTLSLSLSLLVLHTHTYKTLSHFQALSPLSNSYMEESGLFPTRFQYLFPPSLPLLHTHVEGIHPFNTYLFFISSFTCKVSELDKREKSNL